MAEEPKTEAIEKPPEPAPGAAPGAAVEQAATGGGKRTLFLIVGVGVVLGCVGLGVFLLMKGGDPPPVVVEKKTPERLAPIIFQWGSRAVTGKLKSTPRDDGRATLIKLNFNLCVSSNEVASYLDGEFARSKITNFTINLIGNTTLDDIGAGDGDRHLATRIVQFVNDELLAKAADFGQKWTGDKDPQVQELLWKEFILETR